jgi:hypothetical protein
MRAFHALPLILLSVFAGDQIGRAASDEVTLAVAGRSNQTPWMAASGRFVAVAWGATSSGGSDADVFVAFSRDAGVSFGAPVRVNAVEREARLGGELPPRVGLVPGQTGAEPAVVVAYGAKTTAGTEILVARSTDGGRTFGRGRPVQAAGAAGDRGWHALTVDDGGNAHVMWLDHRGLAAQKAAQHNHREAQALDGAAMARHSGLFYAREGASRVSEREITTGVCYCCKVAMAVAPASWRTNAAGGRPAGPAIAAAWRHVYPGNIRDIAFTVSRDGGTTFSPPARVSADEWQIAGCPDDGPAMAADSSGRLHVIWPTVVGGPAPKGAIFHAVTNDGETFSPRTRIPTMGSPRPMHPQILASADGSLVVAWDEVIQGVRQAAVRRITVGAARPLAFGDVIHLSEAGETSSYPVLAATPRGPLVAYVSGKPGASTIVIRALDR